MPHATDGTDRKKSNAREAKDKEAVMVEASAAAASVAEKAARTVVVKAAPEAAAAAPAEAEVQKEEVKEVKFGDILMHGRRSKSAPPTS